MNRERREPAWILLYALAPAVLALGWLDQQLALTTLQHTLLKLVGLGLLCLAMPLWIHMNRVALLRSTPVSLTPTARQRYLVLPYDANTSAHARRLEAHAQQRIRPTD